MVSSMAAVAGPALVAASKVGLASLIVAKDVAFRLACAILAFIIRRRAAVAFVAAVVFSAVAVTSTTRRQLESELDKLRTLVGEQQALLEKQKVLNQKLGSELSATASKLVALKQTSDLATGLPPSLAGALKKTLEITAKVEQMASGDKAA